MTWSPIYLHEGGCLPLLCFAAGNVKGNIMLYICSIMLLKILANSWTLVKKKKILETIGGSFKSEIWAF